MTLLKKPITVTIEHVENAVLLLHQTPICPASTQCQTLWEVKLNYSIYDQLNNQLSAQGINPETWLPPQPFEITSGRTCAFNADGSVKLSCGDVISNEKIEEFLKRRQEAREVSEWPKYYQAVVTRRIYRANSAVDIGEWFENGWNRSSGGACEEWAKNKGCLHITRAEAAAIVGESNL